MKKRTVVAPTRVDLAGGTLDIWPLAPMIFLAQGGKKKVQTVNMAIDRLAKVEVGFLEEGESSFQEESIYQILEKAYINKIKNKKIFLSSSVDVPRGSGLGGSSALLVAALYALDLLLEEPSCSLEELCYKAMFLETGFLHALAGSQDHLAAGFGGVSRIEYGPTGVKRYKIEINENFLNEHLVLSYSGKSHLSGFSNGLMMQKVLQKDSEIMEKFLKIADISESLPDILTSYHPQKLGEALSLEWKERRTLADGITTLELDSLYETALQAGALGGKVCGAGGGGVLVMVAKDQNHQKQVQDALQKAGGLILPFKVSLEGVHEIKV